MKSDNEIKRERTFEEELPYFKERIKEVFDNYSNPNGNEDTLEICVLRQSNRIVKKAEETIRLQQAQIDFYKKHEKPTLVSGFKVENGNVVFYVNILDRFRYVYNDLEEVVKELNRMLQHCYNKDEIVSHLKATTNKLQTAKADAIKEFAERLKEELISYCKTVVEGNDMQGITETGFEKEDVMTTIDNLAKEMVGEDK